MLPDDFSENSPGDLVEVTDRFASRALAFLPDDLPPPLSLSSAVWLAAESAAYALGNLNGLGSRLPNPMMIARPFARKEALASSRIEGTRADFGQLALFEAEFLRENIDDVGEVANYLRALESAWSSPMPAVSISGIQSLHEILLRGTRGSHLAPGVFRTSAVMIGAAGDNLSTARFVPAPPEAIRGKLNNLVEYSRSIGHTPRLVQLAVLHYQFETIHPFNDGNGRVGRLLIPLQLREWGYLSHPLLYISEYFEREREHYIDCLYRVSTVGDWESWIQFFLAAIHAQANDALRRAQHLLDLQAELRSRYQQLGKPRALPIIEQLFESATITFGRAQELTGVGKQASNALIKGLVEDGVLTEVTGRQRNQIFYAPEIARASMGLS